MERLINAILLNDRIREWAKSSDTADLNTVLDVMEIVDKTDVLEIEAGKRRKLRPNAAGLLPCPFCGNKAVELENVNGDGEDECMMVTCHKCGIGVSGPGGEDGCCDPNTEEAIRAWNRRV